MIIYKNIVKHLKSCVFTCINPELANEAALTIQLLAEQLVRAEQCIYAIEGALDSGNNNDWIRYAIHEYKNGLQNNI